MSCSGKLRPKEHVPLFTRFTLALVLCGLAPHGFSQDKPVVIVKHLEAMRYPDLARQARLQDSISIRLKISSSGDVVDAEASTADTLLNEHPLLQGETVKLVRKWTFGCANCPPKGRVRTTYRDIRLQARRASHGLRYA